MRKKIIKASVWLVGILWLLSAMALDSNTWAPFIVCVICTAYLTLVAQANVR